LILPETFVLMGLLYCIGL